MATRITKSGLTDPYDLRIKSFWIQGYGEPDHEFEKFYRMMNTTHEDERFSYMSGFGQWPQKTYGAAMTADGVYQGYDTTCTPYTYALYFSLEQEAVEDDPHGVLGGKLAVALAQSGRDTLEALAAVPFNNCTATTYQSPWSTGGDSVALLSTVHPIPSGGTFANMPSSHVDLSVATLQASKTRLRKMVNARGLNYAMDGMTLLVGPDLEWLAKEIISSPHIPYAATTTPNAVAKGMTVEVWSRISGDSWFVMADKAGELGQKGHAATCVMRISPEFDRDSNFVMGDRLYGGRQRVGFVFPDARGIDGSTGA